MISSFENELNNDHPETAQIGPARLGGQRVHPNCLSPSFAPTRMQRKNYDRSPPTDDNMAALYEVYYLQE
jgi:hypothetical protein